MDGGIYAILNILTDKLYVGSTANLKSRWKDHSCSLKYNRHKSSYLQRAWNKYGKSSFIFVVLEYVENDNLINRENYWIKKLDCCNRDKGYNICLAAGTILGIKRSKETRAKMSASLRLRVMKPETKEKISKARKGRLSSEETKLKISIAGRGRKHSEETKLKMSNWHKGKIFSDETRKRMSLAAQAKCW